jgi:hypothetical protein
MQPFEPELDWTQFSLQPPESKVTNWILREACRLNTRATCSVALSARAGAPPATSCWVPTHSHAQVWCTLVLCAGAAAAHTGGGGQ